MTKPPLVLFDIDGTLVRNAGAHHKNALAQGIFEVLGIRTSLDGVPTSGMLDCDLIRGMLQASGVAGDISAEHMARVMEASQAAYLTNCALTLTDKVCPGVIDVLQGLQHQGAVLGVVTGNLSRIGWKKLELAGLRQFFSLGAFAEDGSTRTELAQAASRRALEQNLISPHSPITLIGDHTNDIRAAQESRFQSVAVATGFLTVEELSRSHPDQVVNDLTELDIRRLL